MIAYAVVEAGEGIGYTEQIFGLLSDARENQKVGEELNSKRYDILRLKISDIKKVVLA